MATSEAVLDRSSAEATTRERVLRLVVTAGPVSVVELAHDLGLTPAGVRRHVAALEDAGEVAVHAVHSASPAGRGRPARRYVATDRGRAALSDAYSDLATQAMQLLAQVGGEEAVAELAARRVRDLEQHLVARLALVDGAADDDEHTDAADDVAERAAVVAAALTSDGYAASARPVPGGRAVQLCQGHCPVRDVAALFPQLCEAETRMLSRVLGVHVQRLSTLAAGGHVCTTHIPTAAPQSHARPSHRPTSDPAAAGPVEGAR